MPFVPLRKQVEKIYQKIDSIAKLGQDNFQEYYDYIDDLIFKGNYGLYTQVMYVKYDFDYTKYLSVDDVKKRSWPFILIRTNTKFQDDKYKLLKDNNLYQYGYSIYLEGTNSTVVGYIKEIDKYLEPIDGLAYTDSEYQQIIKNKILYLSVDKPGITQSSTFSTWNFEYSFDKNLLNLYKEAISYLI